MGDNSFGQLGIGNKDLSYSSFPTLIKSLSQIKKVVAGHHSLAISAKGALYFWGSGVFGSFYEPRLVIEKDIVDASVGGSLGIA
jgi:alpha-tubulin suppressor-like RCC1 family protein